MDNRLLLVTGITLLYRESQITGIVERSNELVREILAGIKKPETNLSLDPETRVIEGLRQLNQAMIDNPPDHQYHKNEILQKIAIIAQDDEGLIDAVRIGLNDELSQTELKQICLNHRVSIKNHFREAKVGEIITKANSKMKFDRQSLASVKQFVAELVAQLEPYTMDAVVSDPAIVSDVDFAKKASVVAVYDAIQSELGGESIMVTGWQGLNDATQGGFRRGEQWVVGALQHKYKTGFTLNIFKHLAIYNTPFMLDPAKKPLLVRISFEDDIQLNMRFLYRSLKENETGRKVTNEDMAGLTSEEIADYVIAQMGKTGYYIKMYRVDPTKWTYLDLINLMIGLEAEGYEIHAVVVDYLKMLPTTGCVQGATGDDVRDMFRRIRNFTNPRKILFITPHQLSSEAKQLVRDGETDFVKKINEQGFYDGCKRLDQEVDGELYVHIEKYHGESYLTVQRGKHRLDTILPEDMKYYVMKFEDVAGIPDDFGREVTLKRKKVGGGTMGSVDETPWSSMDI